MQRREAIPDLYEPCSPKRHFDRFAALSITLHAAVAALLILTVHTARKPERRTHYLSVTLLAEPTPKLYSSRSDHKPEPIATPVSPPEHKRTRDRPKPVPHAETTRSSLPELTPAPPREAVPASSGLIGGLAVGSVPATATSGVMGGEKNGASDDGEGHGSAPIPLAEVAHPPELISRVTVVRKNSATVKQHGPRGCTRGEVRSIRNAPPLDLLGRNDASGVGAARGD